MKNLLGVKNVNAMMADPNWTAAGLLQRKNGVGTEPGHVPPIVPDVLRSPGEPLTTAARSFMESRFGRDLSQVRVHTDGRAAESALAVSARAYTVGRSIVFGAGEYAPETPSGRMLLAHELTHVVQQGEHTAIPTRIGAPDVAEQEAQRAARAAAVGGELASPAISATPSVQRQEIPDFKLRLPQLEARKPAGLSLFPPGEAPRLSLGLEEDLLRKHGITGIRPRPGLIPNLSGQLEKPDPLGRGLPAEAEGPAEPEKKERLGDLWTRKFELDVDKSSALGQMLARQKKEKALLTALSGTEAESSPLGMDLLNAGINILGELPPLRDAREKVHRLLHVKNITIVADDKSVGAIVEFRFGGRTW